MLLNVMMHGDKNPPVQHLIYISVKLTAGNFVLYGDFLLASVRS
jgi:hypothetical protein